MSAVDVAMSVAEVRAKAAAVMGAALGPDGMGSVLDSLSRLERSVADLRGRVISPDDAEWVGEHGGLEHVRDIWDEMVNLCATIGCEPDIVTDALEALGDCTDIVNKRLMPPGYEWPRFEDGEKVTNENCPDDAEGVFFALDSSCWAPMYYVPDNAVKMHERVKRPKQYPIGADGLPIKKGDTVLEVGTVLAIPMTVVEVSRDIVRCEYACTDGKACRTCCSPDTLTHVKPEIDTWQRIEEDARGLDSGIDCGMLTHTHEDIVRRCKALAERVE